MPDRSSEPGESEEIEALRRELAQARERFDVFTSTLPGISWETWGRPDVSPVSYVSSSVEAITGYTSEEWQDRPQLWLEIMHPEDRPRIARELDESYARGDVSGAQEYRWTSKDGREIWAHVRFSILRDEAGEPIVWQAFTLDVTRQKAAEAERDRMHQQLIQSQAALLAELSTPLIPISDDVVTMPLIGRIDPARADRVLEVLLHGLAATRARFAIVDITGVPSVDAEVASALLRVARASRLLGAEVVITGVRPEAAVAFVGLDEQLKGIVTCADLQRGIAYAMARAEARR